MVSGNGSVLICLDEYNEGEMSGRIYSVSETEPDHFTSAVTLVKRISKIFDEGNGPQSTMRVRGFYKNKTNNEKNSNRSGDRNQLEMGKNIAAKINARGKQATFRVRIMFRQNASWQGTVYWIEKNKEENFRSVLELFMLMDSSFATEQAAKGLDQDIAHVVNAV